MNNDLQQKLYGKYPTLFRQKDLSMSQTCMCWGIECGDGWYDLIDQVCNRLLEFKGVEFMQVKEKFGELRIYTDGLPAEYSDKVWDIIGDATEESRTVCEVCGEPGKIRSLAWIRTLCDHHYDEAVARGGRLKDRDNDCPA